MAIINAKNLWKSYGTGDNKNTVIKGVDLEIPEGAFMTLTGKSGAGKSTLLYVLSGLEKIDSGEIYLDKERIDNLSNKKLSIIRREKIGFVFQAYNLLPTISVYDNIALSLELLHRKNKEIKEKVYALAKELEITQLLKSYPYQLSGGEQQRVAIARAVACDPQIIFADEPTGNLDTANSKRVMDLMARINCKYKVAILMVTHDQDIVKSIENRICLSDGRVITEYNANDNK